MAWAIPENAEFDAVEKQVIDEIGKQRLDNKADNIRGQ
jgi:hypothetical protein